MGKTYTITDINRAGFNLEPTRCRNCGNSAFFNFGMGCVMCEYCGLIDDGSSIKKQCKEQGIKYLVSKNKKEDYRIYLRNKGIKVRKVL